jgi:hypothetical protein
MQLGRLRAVFYAIQFDIDLMKAVDRIANAVLSGRSLGMTSDELKPLIDLALEATEPLTAYSFSEHSDRELRQFLRALRTRLP